MNKALEQFANKFNLAAVGWTSFLIMALGIFGLGYCVASINYQYVMSQERLQHAEDVRNIADGYRSALASKDETIKALSRQTVQAAATANSAAKTANAAATKAAQAVDGKHP